MRYKRLSRILIGIFAVMAILGACSQKNPLPAEPPVVIPPIVQEVLTDSSIIDISESFEQLLIEKRIINDAINDGKTLYLNVKNVDTIVISIENLSNWRFKSIKGIKYFSNLVYLDIHGSYVDSLDLSGNPKLRYLDCSGLTLSGAGTNQTIRYLNVSKCKDLEYLNCKLNILSNLDVSSNINLCYLNFHLNDISTINLTNNKKLVYFNSSYNRKIRNLDFSTTDSLKYLYCAANFLPKLDLKNLSELLELNCSENIDNRYTTFTSLDLSNNKKLTYLAVAWTTLTEINLDNNNALSELDISGMLFLNKIQVNNLPNLTYLNMEDSVFSSIDLSHNRNLKYLFVSNTKMHHFNLTNNVNLKNFVCMQQDSIQNLDLKACKKLELCYTIQCQNLKTICVNNLPNPNDENWRSDNFSQYSLCK